MAENEIVDVVDREGNVLGSINRDECHRRKDLIHRVVHFTLYNRDTREVLFTKRAMTKRFDPGKSIFSGEHVLSGESYDDSLVRGVQEELGFTPTDFVGLSSHLFEFENETEFAKFFVVFCNGEKIIADSHEIEKMWWIKIDNLSSFDENIGDITKYWMKNIDWNCLENK